MTLFFRLWHHICGNILNVRIKPRTIQLPITNYCNSKCTTCNIWKLESHQHIDPNALKDILNAPYFNKVETVGLNGGEPSLHNKFSDVLSAVLVLPKLKDIYIISNGMSDKILLPKLETAKIYCQKKNVNLHVTVSLDGTSNTHNNTRGILHSFEKTFKTLQLIAENPQRYCDYLDVGYTISRRNATDMIAVKVLLDLINVEPFYHIAVPNKRIYTYQKSEYSILNDYRSMCLAREFFYSSFMDAKTIKNKLKYFINFYFLKNNSHKRIAMCNYLNRDVTIDEKLNLYLCATASDSIGSLTTHKITDLIKNGCFKNESKRIRKDCLHCIHYAFAPTLRGIVLFAIESCAKQNLIIDLLCARLHI